jgi:2,5-diketo-D-gluconate reductase A
MSTVPTVTLNTGAAVPQLGFGVFQVPPAETAAAVVTALEAGYRHLDTAAIYENEEAVGAGIAAAGIPREELFVTTKLWNDGHGAAAAADAFARSLARLGLDYVDLYLIHWPVPSADRYVETWEALQAFAADGRARALGVSNFQPAHLERILAAGGAVPAANQVELHPYLQQAGVRAANAAHGVVTQAWSPLAQGGVLDDPVLARIAEKHGRPVAQIALRWNLQLGDVVLTKSVTPERIRANLDVVGFTLDDEDLAAIAALDRGGRVGPDPDAFGAD